MSERPLSERLDAACKCNLHHRLAGDGCQWCNASADAAALEQENARLREIINPGRAAAYEEGMAALEQRCRRLEAIRREAQAVMDIVCDELRGRDEVDFTALDDALAALAEEEK